MTREEAMRIAKPIKFNEGTIKDILDNKKTVTRRKMDEDIINNFVTIYENESLIGFLDEKIGKISSIEKLCRYKKGDIVYIRETSKNKQEYS